MRLSRSRGLVRSRLQPEMGYRCFVRRIMTRSLRLRRMSGFVKGLGCRPVERRRRVFGGRRPKASKGGGPQMERLDMNEPIVEVIGLAHGEFVKNGVTVRTELGDSLPPIQGDRVQLQHVMLNLVINAIQAMSDVRDSKRELDVTTGVVESGESVCVAVRHTGPGASAENVEGLFQAYSTTKPH